MSTLSIPAPDEGAIFVISGPSGVGKSTLLERLLDRVPHLGFSVSATTRAPRRGETDGVHYHFLDDATFLERVGEGAFLEHAEVYGRRYGTLRAEVDRLRARGVSVLLDIDAQGSAQVRETAPEAVHLFILPPDLPTLEARLRARDTDDEATIARRMREAGLQLRAAGSYDHVIVNDDLDAAAAQVEGVVLAELCRPARRRTALRRLLDALPEGAQDPET